MKPTATHAYTPRIQKIRLSFPRSSMKRYYYENPKTSYSSELVRNEPNEILSAYSKQSSRLYTTCVENHGDKEDIVSREKEFPG